MTNLEILKRLYNDYTKIFIIKILLAVFFSILVAGSTSATAWLLDPAIEKIFINQDQTLIFVIPILIVLAFSTKGISLYMAKVIMINVATQVKFCHVNSSSSLVYFLVPINSTFNFDSLVVFLNKKKID